MGTISKTQLKKMRSWPLVHAQVETEDGEMFYPTVLVNPKKGVDWNRLIRIVQDFWKGRKAFHYARSLNPEWGSNTSDYETAKKRNKYEKKLKPPKVIRAVVGDEVYNSDKQKY